MGAVAATPIDLTDLRILVRIAAPQFSPDGRQIAFLTVRSDFVHDRYDATLRVISTQELSDAPNGVQQYAWSPNGNNIAYVTPDDSPLSDKDRRTSGAARPAVVSAVSTGIAAEAT